MEGSVSRLRRRKSGAAQPVPNWQSTLTDYCRSGWYAREDRQPADTGDGAWQITQFILNASRNAQHPESVDELPVEKW